MCNSTLGNTTTTVGNRTGGTRMRSREPERPKRRNSPARTTGKEATVGEGTQTANNTDPPS
eukprot:8628946-Lingulodinium_polyedra.AAC.1